MPTYIMLAKWTEAGIKAINDAPKTEREEGRRKPIACNKPPDEDEESIDHNGHSEVNVELDFVLCSFAGYLPQFFIALH